MEAERQPDGQLIARQINVNAAEALPKSVGQAESQVHQAPVNGQMQIPVNQNCLQAWQTPALHCKIDGRFSPPTDARGGGSHEGQHPAKFGRNHETWSRANTSKLMKERLPCYLPLRMR